MTVTGAAEPAPTTAPSREPEEGLLREVEAFLLREARLLDQWRLEEWLDLWHPGQALLHVPHRDDHAGPDRHVAIIRDDRLRLEERVFRLSSEDVYSQEPRSATVRAVTNVEVTRTRPGEVEAEAVQLIVEVRRNHQELYAARARYLLQAHQDSWAILEKHLQLSRSDAALDNLVWLL